MTFKEIKIKDKIKENINKLGFTNMTPIQEKVLPYILNKKDVMGISQTGSGKTFAFGIPMIENIDVKFGGIQALVVCPTRELAIQTTKELKKITQETGVKVVPVYGGSDIKRQIVAIKKKANIIVGTPGRIIDHLDRKTIKLGLLRTIVLDEADEMLNMGFRPDIEKILKRCPEKRQTIMFSATMPAGIQAISNSYMKNPEKVEIERDDYLGKIEQYFLSVKKGTKFNVLLDLIKEKNPYLSLVFCNTKAMVDKVAKDLNNAGYKALGIHSDKRQSERKRIMDDFKSHNIHFLIATDVAARGIDVKGIDIVFNYDLPQDAEFYTHRIGRTGRASNSGCAYTLISSEKQMQVLKEYEKILKSDIKKIDAKSYENKKAILSNSDVNYNDDINSLLLKVSKEKDFNKESKILNDLSAYGYKQKDLNKYLIRIISNFMEINKKQNKFCTSKKQNKSNLKNRRNYKKRK